MPATGGPSYTVITDPASLRWRHYRRDLLRFWRRRHREPDVEVAHWRDVIERRGDLVGLIAQRGATHLRIESPARDVKLLLGLAEAGQRHQPGAATLDDKPRDLDGWIVPPRAVYRGLCRVLDGLAASLERCPHLQATADLSHIALLFDKNATSDRLAAAGIPTPPVFRPAGSPADLLAELRERRWQSSYVKLAHGSCASGIAIVDASAREPVAATTMVEIDGRFYNTRWLRRSSGRALERALAFLINQGATAQPAIPKARVGGQHFDVRVVVTGGQVAATVFRVSSHPITNLHLGGRRGDPSICRRLIPQRQWLDGLDDCAAAASLFKLPTVGVDLLFEQHSYRPYVLELNAFGDFLPNWVDEQGRTLHLREIECTARTLDREGLCCWL